MEKKEILKKINEIFRDVLNNDSIQLKEETTAKDIPEWDSVSHFDLVVTLEEVFEVHFSMNEANELNNIGEMIQLIKQKIK